ncbi:replication protein A [Teladorsagia circumcincta]|uniref:Replication protein A n=1 Tax=Teladorsagia circumcincta TaxID=45464 RepID=A0A2G9UUY1_TELCI|nr:replication protein A [Teladorsagia circumcincta]
MAWNESFSVADAGGWAGDVSFATSAPKEALSVKVAERLPVPVTVADLHDTASAEENIREVIDDKEYRAFKLEAKIAKLYFEKNVPSILRSGMGQSLTGCAAGPPADANPAAAQGEVMNVFGTQPARIYGSTSAVASSSSRGHNLDGQRGKIMDLLQREKDNYEAIGLSEGDIKSAIGAVNMDSLRKDLQFLVNEGHIYNTTDDEHYALID